MRKPLVEKLTTYKMGNSAERNRKNQTEMLEMKC